MNFRSLLLLLLCSILLIQSTLADYWKHSEQQGNVGACHTFATLALIEAEYFKSTKKHLNLSERDLFIRHFSQGSSSPENLIQQQLHNSTKKKLPDHYKEAGHIEDDFRLIQQHGVASERKSPYTPLFSNGVSISIGLLRHERNELATEAHLLKNVNRWSPTIQHEKISQRTKKLNGVRKTLTLASPSKTHAATKAFANQLKLNKITPTTTSAAKKLITQQLLIGPVAVDITNLSEISGIKLALHGKHSLVLSSYNAKNDTVQIRSSTFKGSRSTPANTIARGTYRIYYLTKK